VKSTTKANRTVVAQTFALKVSDAYLHRYSNTSISFLILSTGSRNIFSHIYILPKQPTLSCCNVFHSTVLL